MMNEISMRKDTEVIENMISFLKKYNAYWVTVGSKEYLCLGYTTNPVRFKLGYFNYLNEEITTIDNVFDDNLRVKIYNDTAYIYKSNGSVIMVKGFIDADHKINDLDFNKSVQGYNLLREDFIDYSRSFDKGNYRYYVIDLYKLGKPNAEDYNFFKYDFEKYNGSGKTLTYCYICNLLTKKIERRVVWDIVHNCPSD